jgi:hypothetical protein
MSFWRSIKTWVLFGYQFSSTWALGIAAKIEMIPALPVQGEHVEHSVEKTHRMSKSDESIYTFSQLATRQKCGGRIGQVDQVESDVEHVPAPPSISTVSPETSLSVET